MNSPHTGLFAFPPLDENNKKWLGIWDTCTGEIVIVTWHPYKGFVRSYVGNGVNTMVFTESDCCEAWFGPRPDWVRLKTDGILGLSFIDRG